MNKGISLLVYIVILQTGNLFSQKISPYRNFTISKLTQDDGLSQGSNYFRFEDSQGFMWITANDALNRYDGKNVKVYNLNKYFKGCPPLQQGYGFAEDKEHNVYVGSTRGLYIYHRNTDKFTLEKIFKTSDDVAMPIGFLNGKIWCFNRLWQIATYDVKTKQVDSITQMTLDTISSLSIYASSASFYFRYPFIDKENSIWMISQNNIASYHIVSKVRSYPLQTLLLKESTFFYSCFYDAANNKILCGTQHGILEFSLATKMVKHIRKIANRILGTVYIVVVRNGLLACRKEKGGLFIVDIENMEIVLEEIKEPYSYLGTYQYGFDKSGRLWMGSDGFGQIIIDFHPLYFNKEPRETASPKFRLNYGVSNFGELPNGDILMHQAMLLQKSKTIEEEPYVFKGLEYYRKNADTFRNGLWFFSTIELKKNDNLILFSDAKNKLSVIIKNDGQDTIDHLTDLQVLPGGKVLCSMQHGLAWLNLEAKSLKKIHELTVENSFKINVLSRNRVAISYINSDMRIVQLLKNDSVVVLKKILSGVQSFYMQEDTKRNVYWVGTNQGVYLLDNTFEVVNKFDANNGMAGTNIYGILLDDSGNVWCSHQRGLSSINANTYQVVNYDKSDGIQDWDFNNRAFYKSKDGTLYFGGVSGFNYFKPPIKPYSFYKPEIYIDEVKVNNEIYMADTNANTIHYMDLEPDQNSIFMIPLVKDLVNAHVRQIIYRLQNSDSVWKYLPNNSPIIFNNLSSGSYTLELGTYDKFGHKETSQKSIILFIATPFYKKFWFQLLLWSFISVLLIWTVYSFARKERKQIQLEKELAVSRHQTQSASINPHFIFNALNSVQHFMNLNDRLSANRYLTSFAKLIRKNFNATKSLEISLSDEIESLQLYLNLERMRQPDRFIYEIYVDDRLELEDIKLPVMILQPFVENAILHGFNKSNIRGELRISFKQVDGNQLEILISDNGVGIKNNSSSDHEHQSSGLEMTQQRIELYAKIKGCETHLETYALHAEDKTNPGHVVKIILPISQDT